MPHTQHGSVGARPGSVRAGVPSGAPSTATSCCPGLHTCRRRRARDSVAFRVAPVAKAFLWLVAIDVALMFALSIVLWALHDSSSIGRVYAALGFFCSAGFAFFAFDAVWSENKFQFVACHAAGALFSSFVVFNAFHNAATLGPGWAAIHYYAAGVKCGFQIAYLALALPVWRAFGWFEYKMAGTDRALLGLFQRYRVFLSLLKLDLFVAFILLFLLKVYLLLSQGDLDFALGLASIALSILFFGLGWYAVTHESRPLFAAFLACVLLQPAYIGFKLWSLYEHPDLIPANVTYPQFIVLGSLTLALRVAVVAYSALCRSGFGQGLKEFVFERRAGRLETRNIGHGKTRREVVLSHGEGGGSSASADSGGEAAVALLRAAAGGAADVEADAVPDWGAPTSGAAAAPNPLRSLRVNGSAGYQPPGVVSSPPARGSGSSDGSRSSGRSGGSGRRGDDALYTGIALVESPLPPGSGMEYREVAVDDFGAMLSTSGGASPSPYLR